MATDKQEDKNANVTEPGDDAAPGTPGTGEDVCPRCNGDGKVDGKQCEDCGGSGYVIKGVGGG